MNAIEDCNNFFYIFVLLSCFWKNLGKGASGIAQTITGGDLCLSYEKTAVSVSVKNHPITTRLIKSRGEETGTHLGEQHAFWYTVTIHIFESGGDVWPNLYLEIDGSRAASKNRPPLKAGARATREGGRNGVRSIGRIGRRCSGASDSWGNPRIHHRYRFTANLLHNVRDMQN